MTWLTALALSIAVALAGMAWAAGSPHASKASNDPPKSVPTTPIQWPGHGQAAVAISGGALIGSSGGRQPVPIASLAKMMTAYLVLRDHPRVDDGFSLTITPAIVSDTAARRRRGESVVAVRAGEILTEQQALTAILLPSANNIAVALAARDAGSVTAFVDKMNRVARGLAMTQTQYTDPSGYDPATVSTALDQLRLTSVVMHLPAFARLVALRAADLPVVGRVRNTNTLVGRDGFIGTKTGSDTAAGGCLAFAVERRRGSATALVFGVVLGQRGGALIPAALAAARRLVR
jgi:serine-type D-Ala-D-Ala carboxypeptidase (penicillin-binding protein 5/6)